MLISLGSLGVYAPTRHILDKLQAQLTGEGLHIDIFFQPADKFLNIFSILLSAESLSSKSAITALSSCCSASYFSKS